MKANKLPLAHELEGAFPLEAKQKALDKAVRTVERITKHYLTPVEKAETALLGRDPFRLAYPPIGAVVARRDGNQLTLEYDHDTQSVIPWMDPAEFEIHYQTGYSQGETPAILKELVTLLADWFLLKETSKRAHIMNLLQIAKRLT